jgi:HAMP domain-containing protein
MDVRQKLLGAFLAAAALAATPVGLVLYADTAAARKAAIAEAKQVARGIADEVSYAAPAGPLIDEPSALAEYLRRLHSLQHRDIAVVGRDLKILGDVVPASVGRRWTEDRHGEVAATIADGTARTFVEKGDDYSDGIQQVVVRMVGPGNAVEGAVVLEFTPLYHRMTAVTSTARRVVFVVGPICVLLILLLGALIARSITRRTEMLTWAVQVVEKGDYSQRVELRGTDEISRLGHAFDGMVERLDSTAREVLTKE